ncbi:hypothetical protein D7V97_40470 [Corallococcus sp. CA053C]|nr:hypothetical protein D7V97_40470 [Corallococcus sp. CA053C]
MTHGIQGAGMPAPEQLCVLGRDGNADDAQERQYVGLPEEFKVPLEVPAQAFLIRKRKGGDEPRLSPEGRATPAWRRAVREQVVECARGQPQPAAHGEKTLRVALDGMRDERQGLDRLALEDLEGP